MPRSKLGLFHLLPYKGQSYQITFLSIIVADGTMDQMSMKTVMKTVMTTFLSSIVTEMTMTELRATGGRSQIEALCFISKLTEGVSTQMTKNIFKPVRGCVHLCTQRGGGIQKPLYTPQLWIILPLK